MTVANRRATRAELLRKLYELANHAAACAVQLRRKAEEEPDPKWKVFFDGEAEATDGMARQYKARIAEFIGRT